MRPFLFLLMLLLAPIAYACGPDSDCILGDRSYRISIPEGATAPVGRLSGRMDVADRQKG